MFNLYAEERLRIKKYIVAGIRVRFANQAEKPKSRKAEQHPEPSWKAEKLNSVIDLEKPPPQVEKPKSWKAE